MRTSRPALSLLFALCASCAAPSGPRGDGALHARAEPPRLVLENRGGRTGHFFAIEQDLAARALWRPCDRPARCPSVRPGETRAIPYDSVPGYAPGARVARVYWWPPDAAPSGGLRPDSIRAWAVPF